MKNPFRSSPRGEPDPINRPVAGDADVQSAIRRLTEDDERPSREDRDYGATIFSRPPVDLPRILTGRSRSRRR